MIEDFEKAYREIGNWVEAAAQAGWLSQADRKLLERIETATAEDLFGHKSRRPLVVGLFGGTGVGKSSRLNRLAGEPITDVGIERPTSRGVTLYIHESHEVTALPEEFPLERTRIATHSDPSRHDLVWIDMPDIDSTERSNRELVFAWLPYIDWLIYVVSPERYRDDAGWNVLRQRGHRHHWLFVMNQWDLGQPGQIKDFLSDLKEAGFDLPTVITTSCIETPAEDDFDRLEGIIRDAIEAHGLIELRRLGLLARMRDLARLAATLGKRFGDDASWKNFIGAHRANAKQLLQQLNDHLQWPIETIANRFRSQERGWFRRRPEDTHPTLEASELQQQLWSEQAQVFLEDIVNQAVVAAERQVIAPGAVQRVLQSNLNHADQTLMAMASEYLSRALLKPGTALLRGVRGTARALCYLLPLVSAIWVIYNVVWKYQQALAGSADFLGIDFTLHSLLLIFLSWLTPYLVYRLLKPSLRASARRGLQRGVDTGITEIKEDIENAYAVLSEERARLLRSLRVIDLPSTALNPR